MKSSFQSFAPRALCSLALIVTLSFEIAGRSDAAADESWPRFLNRDFSGSIQKTFTEKTSQWPWQQPTRCRWTLPVGEGYEPGVIDRDAYFHFDVDEDQERLRKIDLATGTEIWSKSHRIAYRDLYQYESGARCSPTIDGDQIFTLGVAGTLTASHVDTGEVQWRIETNERYHVVQNFFGVGSAPLVIDETVIVMVGGSPIADQEIAPGRLNRVSPDGSLLVALDRRTGKELWKCGDDLASYSSPRPIRINDNDYVLVLARDFLHLIDPINGVSLGQIPYRADLLESVNAMVPVVSGNRVLASDCYDLGATLFEITIENEAASFTPIWKDPEGNRRAQSLRCHLSTPILQNGFLYGCSGRNAPDSDFRCVDFATGKVQWTALDRRRSTASRIGDVLLVLKETGDLHIVRCTPGKYDEIAVWSLGQASTQQAAGEKNRPALRYPCWAAPIIVDDCMVIRGDEQVICLELPR